LPPPTSVVLGLFRRITPERVRYPFRVLLWNTRWIPSQSSDFFFFPSLRGRLRLDWCLGFPFPPATGFFFSENKSSVDFIEVKPLFSFDWTVWVLTNLQGVVGKVMKSAALCFRPYTPRSLLLPSPNVFSVPGSISFRKLCYVDLFPRLSVVSGFDSWAVLATGPAFGFST